MAFFADVRAVNLFANCVIALDALTGERKWHFQEIRHDSGIWMFPAPSNLVSVTRDGKKVDAVAQVTKIGNTLLLDRVTGKKPLFPSLRARAEPRCPNCRANGRGPISRTWNCPSLLRGRNSRQSRSPSVRMKHGLHHQD